MTESFLGDGGELSESKRIESLLLVAPPYVFMVFWSFAHSYASDKFGNRFWFYMYPIPVVLVGCFIFMFARGFGPRYFAMFLMVFIFAMNGTVSFESARHVWNGADSCQIYAWIANAIPRPPAKRAAALAFINSVGNAASICKSISTTRSYHAPNKTSGTPFTYFDWSAPYYYPAMGIIIGLAVIAGICGLAMKFILERENAQLARMENSDVELTESDMKKLRKTAEMEGIDIAAARQLQKGYRFMV